MLRSEVQIKGGEQQIGTAERILAEIISARSSLTAAALLVPPSSRCGSVGHFQPGNRWGPEEPPKGAAKCQGLGAARWIQARLGKQLDRESTAVRV
jgi:hypothetical protein